MSETYAFAGTVAVVSGVWGTASNALTRDGAFATSASSPCRLALRNYGFAIPGTSTIRRIGVNLFARNASAVEADRETEVFLTTDGTNPASAGLTQVIDTINHGFLYELDEGRWGLALTPTDVNSVNFGVLVGKKNLNASTLEIDSAEVIVEYSESDVYSGRGGRRIFVAQFGATAYIADGQAPLMKDRGAPNTPFFLAGLKAPTQAPTVAAGAAGVMLGTKYVYVTFFNAADRVRSNPSPVSSAVVLSNQQLVVSNIQTHRDLREANSSDIRREVWVTLAGSAEAFRAAEVFDNTTTSVTIDMTDADGEVGEFLERTRNDVPQQHRYLAVLKERLISAGEAEWSETVAVTNGSRRVQVTFAASTPSLQRLSASIQEGKWLAVDGHSERYVIQSVDGPESLTLESPYSGTTGSGTGRIFSDMATSIDWSQTGGPESYNRRQSKTFAVQDADQITAIFALEGRIMVFMNRHIGAFSWHQDPFTDGTLQTLVFGRGALESCVVMAEGMVYAMDTTGIYRYSGSGSAVQEIDGPVRPVLEGRSGEPTTIAWANRENFWALADERHGMVHFFFAATGDSSTNTRYALTYNYVQDSWMLCAWDGPVICGGQLLLTDGRIAPVVATTTGFSYFWEFWVGPADGMVQAGLAMTGTVTSATATTLTATGAGWPTTNNGLTAIQIRTRAPGGTWRENRRINSNTSDVITIGTAWDVTPIAGDEYALGRIDAWWQSGWVDFGAPMMRKRVHEARLQIQPSTGATIGVQFYTDWSSSALASEMTLTDEDGVDVTAGATEYTIDPNQASWASGQGRIRLGAIMGRLASARINLGAAGTRPIVDEIFLTAELSDEIEV